ncbi:MAG: PAS domain-containing protein [Deferribacteres bacterium]|nr:PAS domain-containing protein [Deferribacteres bacterium]
MEKTKIKRVKEITDLTNAIDVFTTTTQRLEKAYNELQGRVNHLNSELDIKNQELSTQVFELNSLRRHFDNVLESMRTGMIAIDLNGNITLFNKSIERITGLSREEVIHKGYEDVFPIDEEERKDALATLQSGCAFNDVEDIIILQNKTEIPIRRTTSLIMDEKDHIVGAMDLIDDVTELKALQKDIEKKNTLAALGEMSRQVAHEIRNPLGGIAGFAALLERECTRDPVKKKYVRKIIEGIGVLDQLVSDLLLYTRPLTPRFRSVDITKITSELLAFARIKHDQNNKIHIQQNYAKGPINTRLDTQLYQELILHLFNNATRVLPTGGEFYVNIRADKIKRNAVLEFIDNGPGIDPEVKQKLFLPFFSTNARGIGLGLSIVQRIVDIHHGTIMFNDSVPRGTKITITIPLHAEGSRT